VQDVSRKLPEILRYFEEAYLEKSSFPGLHVVEDRTTTIGGLRLDKLFKQV